MITPTLYRRTPLPKGTFASGWMAMCLWMALIFSPFVSFTLNGRVDGSNWTPTLITAGAALAGLTWMALRSAWLWHHLPAEVRLEYKQGKPFPAVPLSAKAVAPPLAVPMDKKECFTLQLTSTGVTMPVACLTGASLGLVVDYVALQRTAAALRTSPPPASVATHSLPWSDIAEWQVHCDSEGPDFYRLMLANGSYWKLQRPSETQLEPALLDYVRHAGGVAVRLFCDIV